MRLLDLTLPTPAENLALEESLLEWGEEHEEQCLRLWESPDYFVVLGAGSPVRTDTNVAACRQAGVPILRRCSGGGTVVQGPGCLNYTLVLDTTKNAELKSISGTNEFVLSRIAGAITETRRLLAGGQQSVAGHISMQGYSDLTLDNLKFSGNAQRRRRRFILFHGTVLHDFDLQMIFKLLGTPEKMPDYRAERSHDAFITNLHLPVDALKTAIAAQFDANTPLPDWPVAETKILASTRYADQEWVFRI